MMTNKETSMPSDQKASLPDKKTPEQQIKQQTIQDNKKPTCIKHDKWLVVGASVTGMSHLRTNPPVPCQDSHVVLEIEDGWGVAVVCDGAGTAGNSHHGSAFVVRTTAKMFKEIVKEYKWHKRVSSCGSDIGFPSQEDWHQIAQKVFVDAVEKLQIYSKEIGVSVETLACTVISVIYSPEGMLIAHIGDGRAAYCDAQGQWKAMMSPLKGEEANQTVFITSPIWNNLNSYMETRVIKEKISAFALMSDGCEKHSFEVNIKKPDEEKYYDPNTPYTGFFNPLVNNIQEAYKSKISDTAIGEKWSMFIEAGNSGLKNETDDKTMIIGVFVR